MIKVFLGRSKLSTYLKQVIQQFILEVFSVLHCLTLMHIAVTTTSLGIIDISELYKGLLTEQCGQTNPLMFSMMPRIRTPVFLQKVISLLTSPVETACNQHITGRTIITGYHRVLFIVQYILNKAAQLAHIDK